MSNHRPFQPWLDDKSPFDMLGLPHQFVNRDPPPQDIFERAISRARLATKPARLAREPQYLTMLPYNHEHIEAAIQYFTQGEDEGPEAEKRGRLDIVSWEVVFDDFIVAQGWCYYRTWAPELISLDAVIGYGWHSFFLYKAARESSDDLVAPSYTVATTGIDEATGDSQERIAPVEEDFPGWKSVFAQARAPLTPNQLRFERSVDVMFEYSGSSSAPAPPSSPSVPTPSPPQTPALEQHQAEHEDSTCRESRAESTRVFAGFHREQLHKAGRHNRPGEDYRQAVYCHTDVNGRKSWHIARTNMSGEKVPYKYRLRQSSSLVNKADILVQRREFGEDFMALIRNL